ncbi:MAG: helix-turn-helix domain-containing protein, partial [Solirubrobacteraceae bacterium]
RQVGYTPSQVIRCLETLEALGLVERHPDTSRYRFIL